MANDDTTTRDPRGTEKAFVAGSELILNVAEALRLRAAFGVTRRWLEATETAAEHFIALAENARDEALDRAASSEERAARAEALLTTPAPRPVTVRQPGRATNGLAWLPSAPRIPATLSPGRATPKAVAAPGKRRGMAPYERDARGKKIYPLDAQGNPIKRTRGPNRPKASPITQNNGAQDYGQPAEMHTQHYDEGHHIHDIDTTATE